MFFEKKNLNMWNDILMILIVFMNNDKENYIVIFIEIIFLWLFFDIK